MLEEMKYSRFDLEQRRANFLSSGEQWALKWERRGRSCSRYMGCFGDPPHCREKMHHVIWD